MISAFTPVCLQVFIVLFSHVGSIYGGVQLVSSPVMVGIQ